MVVGLQVADGLALEDENDRVDDLVVLGDVEEPDVDAETGERGVRDGNGAVGVGQTRDAAGNRTARKVAEDAGGSVEKVQPE